MTDFKILERLRKIPQNPIPWMMKIMNVQSAKFHPQDDLNAEIAVPQQTLLVMHKKILLP